MGLRRIGRRRCKHAKCALIVVRDWVISDTISAFDKCLSCQSCDVSKIVAAPAPHRCDRRVDSVFKILAVIYAWIKYIFFKYHSFSLNSFLKHSEYMYISSLKSISYKLLLRQYIILIPVGLDCKSSCALESIVINNPALGSHSYGKLYTSRRNHLVEQANYYPLQRRLLNASFIIISLTKM